MSTRKHLILLLAVCLTQVMALAAPRSYQQAVKIAQQQAARLGITMDATPQQQTRSAASDAAYYVIGNGQNKGYTIVSADDRLPAIVGYTVQGNFDERTLPAPYVAFITAYQKFAEAVVAGDARAVRLAAEAQALRESSSYAQPTVAPLLGNTQWNQGSPYNNLCPEYEKGKRSATGCVATAMAQVMAYWKYPLQLQTSTSAYTTSTNKIAVPAIDKDTAGTYDWDNMLPQYKTEQYNDTQAAAVAKLMYHCGAAIRMDYGESSGAYINAERLATYFGYDKDLMMDLYRETFSLEQWNTLIDTELKAERPVLYSGQSSDGGHQFVCDGSNGEGLYHINWGWGGYQDGYFDITILNPEKGGIGSGSASDGFNQYSDMIIGIQPDNGKTDEPLATLAPIYAYYYAAQYHSLTLTTATREDATKTFSFNIQDLFANFRDTPVSGYVAYGIKKTDNTYVPITDPEQFTKLTTGNGIAPILEGSYAFPVGRTYIHALYSTDGTTWSECGYNGLMPYAFDATDTELTLGHPLTGEVTADKELLIGQSNTMTLKIENDAEADFIGTLNIYVSTDQTRPSSKDGFVYVSVPAKGKSEREITVNVPAETFYLWVTDENTGVDLVNGQQFGAAQGGTPSLTLVKVTSNASDEYETEKAYYGTYQVKLPKVKDNQLTVTYDIRNDGGSAYCDWMVVGFHGQTLYSGAYRSGTTLFPGNGTITSITASFTPEEIGCNSILCELYSITNPSTQKTYDISVTAPDQQINKSDNTGYFRVSATDFLAYVEGTSTGMETVTVSKTYIRGGHGQIDVTTDSDRTITVYRLTGQKVAEVKARAGQAVSIPVASGVYIVNGTKVAVK